MKSNGFTLVELMAVVIILGIIGFISVPAFINSIKSNNIDSYNNIVNDIILSAETYASNANGNLVHIGVKTLQDIGYLKKNIVNPVTDEPMSGCVYMVSGKAIYKEESCSTYIMGLGPDNICNYPIGTTWNYEYDIDKPYYTFNTPCSGTYKVELWGAEGGGTTTKPGGKGAYTSGNIGLTRNTDLYIYVGGEGKHEATRTNVGGYNGGGYSGNNTQANSFGGGGATDIRLENGLWNDFESLKSRIMVAAGGGGNTSPTNYNTTPGPAGGLLGYAATGSYNSEAPTGATQISFGTSSYNGSYNRNGFFGYAPQTNITGWGGGGGSGYFAGATGYGHAGSGGSSFISGHAGSIAITSDSTSENINQRTSNGTKCSPGTTDIVCSYHYSDYIFSDTIMIDGEGHNWTTGKGEYVGQTNPDSTTSAGHTGSGYARVTLVSTVAPQADDVVVRFDANGGVVNILSKKVKYGGTYGNLPIPTKEGYVFKGWNGKNLFDIENWVFNGFASYSNPILRGTYTYENGSITLTATSDDCYTNTWLGMTPSRIVVKPNTTYTLSWKSNNKEVSGKVFVFQNDINDAQHRKAVEQKDTNSLTFTTLSDTMFITFRLGVQNTGNTITYSDVQLEEGITATEYEPYYITSSTPVVQNNNHTLTAIWEEKNATFISGTNFNTRIKQLAGDDNATYETANTSITSIVRSEILTITPKEENIVSTSDSTTPIYAWYDNGTLYYYSEAIKIFANSSSSRMFRDLRNITTIDIKDIDFKNSIELAATFMNDYNLSNIDLTNFASSNPTAVTYMFSDCRSILSLDLSMLDLSNVSNNYTTHFLRNMTSLQSIKTPKAYPTNGVKITLPTTMYDSNGNAYTELDNTSPTSTLLTKTQS